MSLHRVALLVAVMAVPLAAPLAAQQREPVAGRIPGTWTEAPIRRAVVGITVDFGDGMDSGGGYPVSLVTPGGPADRAGIRAGDYVTRVNGQVLASPAQLLVLLSRLQPDDTVAIEYRRGALRRTARVMPMVVNETPVMIRLGEPLMTPPAPDWAGSPGDRAYAFRGPLFELELAPLNPDLGTYFGTTSGVLVINVPRRSSLNLKGGDVVLAVDGRRPDGPLNLMRILRTYSPDDTIRFEVLRAHRRYVVDGQLRNSDR